MTEDQTWPSFDDDEIEAVVNVLRSGRVNRWTGDENRRFEEAFAACVSADHAVALANGTVALELALRSAGIGSGDDVVVTSRSFVASAGVAALVGARPVFSDVDPESQNMTAETLSSALTDASRAVIVVHLGGWICDMDPIMAVARERDLIVVEDCAQALGAVRDGRPAGSWGSVAAWSFCQDKLMTTGGEGGMVTTRDKELWERAWSYKDHGKSFASTGQSSPGPAFKWVHDGIGTNWRMTEMQAAIGRVALPKVDARVSRRNEIARQIDAILSDVPALRTTVPPSTIRHAYYKYYVFVRSEALGHGIDRDGILKDIQSRGVPAFTGICPEIYLEQAFVQAGFAPAIRHPVARLLGETAIMLPIHHNLSDTTASRWAHAVRDAVTRAVR